MPLVLSEDVVDEDFDSLFAIQWKAFAKQPTIKAFFPGGLAESTRSANVARFVKVLGLNGPNAATAKVIDEDSGEICAFATLRLYDKNPFVDGKETDIDFPPGDEKIKLAVQWAYRFKASRRRGLEALQVPGSYCCE